MRRRLVGSLVGRLGGDYECDNMSSARWLHETLAEYRAESSGASKASVGGGGWFQLPRDPAPEELTKALTNFGARFKTKKLNGEQDPSGILDFFDLFALR